MRGGEEIATACHLTCVTQSLVEMRSDSGWERAEREARGVGERQEANSRWNQGSMSWCMRERSHGRERELTSATSPKLMTTHSGPSLWEKCAFDCPCTPTAPRPHGSRMASPWLPQWAVRLWGGGYGTPLGSG